MPKDSKGGHYKGAFTPGKLESAKIYTRVTTAAMEIIINGFEALNMSATQFNSLFCCYKKLAQAPALVGSSRSAFGTFFYTRRRFVVFFSYERSYWCVDYQIPHNSTSSSPKSVCRRSPASIQRGSFFPKFDNPLDCGFLESRLSRLWL